MLQRFGIRRTSDLMALEPDDVQEMVSMGACRSWSFVGGACVRARDASAKLCAPSQFAPPSLHVSLKLLHHWMGHWGANMGCDYVPCTWWLMHVEIDQVSTGEVPLMTRKKLQKFARLSLQEKRKLAA